MRYLDEETTEKIFLETLEDIIEGHETEMMGYEIVSPVLKSAHCLLQYYGFYYYDNEVAPPLPPTSHEIEFK